MNLFRFGLPVLLCLVPLSVRPSDSVVTAAPKLVETTWYSRAEQKNRRVDIYVPTGWCDTMPVLYLLHGVNGCEKAWQEKGGAIDTLEAMIAEGRCRPMLLVMPDVNKWAFDVCSSSNKMWTCLFRYSRLSHEHELEYAVSDLIDHIDSTYHTTGMCIVAGLSDGARISANVANVRPERVSQVGLFSPVLKKEQLPANQQTDSTLSYHVYVGKGDIFYASSRRFHRRMERRHYPHRFIVLRGTHDWPVWRNSLSDFLRQLSMSE